MQTIFKLVGKPEGRRPLGRPRCRGRIILEWILGETVWEGIERIVLLEGVDWIHLAQDSDQWRAVVNTVMKLRVP
jgi:hypothetical protein